MSRFTQFLHRFRKDEDGQILIEFVVMVPLLFTFFMSSIELGMYSFHQVFLDRGLDMAVREIRLTTGRTPKHDEIKNMVCNFSGFLEDCDDTLRLEMTPVDVTDFNGLQDDADCVDVSADPEPPRMFTPGSDHQLMILRACVKFDPIFPTAGIGRYLAKDGAGKVSMLSYAAFVQEPK